MRLVVKRVQDALVLTDNQLASLENYSDSEIEYALKTLKNAQNVVNETAFFLGILKKRTEQQTPSIKAQIEASNRNKNKDPQKEQDIQKSLNDRYTAAEIEHCEKILALFDRISLEDPVEAQKILNRQVSERWSMSWGTPESYERRLHKLKGIPWPTP